MGLAAFLAFPRFASKRWIVSGICSAIVSFALMGVSIYEKTRLRAFFKELDCDVLPLEGTGLSLIRWPPAYAAMLGVAPSDPPYGLHTNMTSATSCKNDMQARISMRAAGSKIEYFHPNVATFGGEGNLVDDAVFASGGGSAEIKQVMAGF